MTRPKTTAPSASSSLPWWIPLAACLVLFVIYWPALNGPPLFDDLNLPVFRTEGHPGWTGFSGVRPLYYLSLYVNYVVSGQDPWPYHLTNLTLHAISGWLVFYILRQLLELTGSTKRAASWLALSGSLVFLFHPLQTEAVSYIASRSECLSTPFAYAAFALLIAAGRRPVGWLRSVSILALLAAGALVKEPVVAMAAVVVLTDRWLSERDASGGVARNWRLHVPLVVAAALGSIGLVLHVTRTSGGSAGLSVAGTTWYEYLFTEFKVIWIYIRLAVFPVGQNLDYDMPHVHGFVDPFALLGLVGLIGLLYLAWKFRSRYPLAALGIVAFLILLSPTSSVIPIADVAAERRVYLSSLGLLLVLVEFLRQWRGPAWKNKLICVTIVALAAGTWSRNHAFGSMIAMWQDSVRGNAQNTRGWVHLGAAYFQADRCSEAANAFERAETLGRREQAFYWDYAAALECDNQIDRAAAEYRKAIAVLPQARAWTLLAGLFGRQRRWDEALDALNQAEALDPSYAEIYSFRGGVYLHLQRFEEADAAYRHALQLQPGDTLSRTGLMKVAAARQSARQKGPFVSR